MAYSINPRSRIYHMLRGIKRSQMAYTATKDVNGTTTEEALFIKCDNQGALAIVSTGIVKRTKHIYVCYYSSRDLHARGIVEYAHIGADENTADQFIKPLAIQKHQQFTAAAGLRRF